ncbi:MAG: peptidoglycan-binding protein [Clostridia bacterium]|nr:peptidoglycan-binding protein [Clostridia bacterium]
MKQLKRGSTGPYVQTLQLALSRSGYYGGELDGIFGDSTLAAVQSFQANMGLTPDGVVGTLTWERLAPYLRGYFVYTVKAGDTLYALAQRFNISDAALKTANPDTDPQKLRIGQKLTIPYPFALVPTNISYTYDLVSFIIDGIVARYPFITRGEIGKSVMGKSLYSLQIGEGEKEVFYNAAHHANEWITTPLVLKFAERYADAVAMGQNIGGQSAQNLFERTTLYIVPLVNPDGVDLVTGALTDGEYYDRAVSFAQSYPDIPFPDGWKANIEGIDTNLSYPAEWEDAREIKFAAGYDRPGPRDFVGDAPLDAVESRAVYDFTLSRSFALTLSYHTQGEVIYWRFLDYLPPRSFEIAQRFAQVSGYTAEETPYASGFAGYKDWFIQNYNLPGYTIEAGRGENPLPVEQFDRIYADNIGILVQGLLQA